MKPRSRAWPEGSSIASCQGKPRKCAIARACSSMVLDRNFVLKLHDRRASRRLAIQEIEARWYPVMELQYERFVENIEEHARAIAHFLGLPWHDAMLDPSGHARERGFISTPSYSQVVQPVSRKAVGRWRNYEAQFGPVLPILQPWLGRWGYPA